MSTRISRSGASERVLDDPAHRHPDCRNAKDNQVLYPPSMQWVSAAWQTHPTDNLARGLSP